MSRLTKNNKGDYYYPECIERTKEQILKAFRWFWNFCVEESEG